MRKRRAVAKIAILVALLLLITSIVIIRFSYPIDAVRSFDELAYTIDFSSYVFKGDDSAYLQMHYMGYPDIESDIFMHINPDPFTKAGLSYEWRYSNVITSDNCFAGTGFGHGFSLYRRNVVPAEALKAFIRQNKDWFTYISDEERYCISFPLGSFEWAKDINATTQDIVYIVYGKTMIENGVDPYAVDGWEYDSEHNWFTKSFDIG